MRRAAIFGAGSVGRGFIAQLLCRAGWQVTFLDVDADLVDALARDGGYVHVTVGNGGSVRSIVGPVTAIRADAPEAAGTIATADLVVSCVGVRALPAVADVLARGIGHRIAGGRGPVDVLLAENLHDCAQVMRNLLADRLPGLPSDVLDAQVGLMEASIGRMIPAPDPAARAADPTAIAAEPYSFLPYDASAARGEPLNVPGFVADPTVPFAFHAARKLYVHNMGHAFTAYLGRLAGIELIWQAIGEPGIRYLVRAAMVESAVALAAEHGVALGPVLEHIDDLLHRFGNRALGDTTARVGRDPARKLGRQDRLIGALELAAARGVPGHYLSLAVASGAVHWQRQEAWDSATLWSRLAPSLDVRVLGESRLALLRAQLSALADGFDFDHQLALIEQLYEPSHVL